MGFYLKTTSDLQVQEPENPYPRFSVLQSGRRSYSTDQGRWISRDPLYELAGAKTTLAEFREEHEDILSGSSSDDIEYLFVNNSPSVKIDVLGTAAGLPPFGGPPRRVPALIPEVDPCPLFKRWLETIGRGGRQDKGVTLCHYGLKYGCIINPFADPIAQQCGQVHEDIHAADPDTQCPDKCGISIPKHKDDLTLTDEEFDLKTECPAYRAACRCINQWVDNDPGGRLTPAKMEIMAFRGNCRSWEEKCNEQWLQPVNRRRRRP